MYKSYKKRNIGFFEWGFIAFFVLFYPLLVSIYTLLPPLIGIAGLVIIYNFEKSVIYTLAGMLYLFNLDLNLSLPLMLSIFSIVLVNVFIYPTTKLMIRCKVCLALFLIVIINGFYYINLFLYDIVLDTHTVVADSMLAFYILVDIIIGLLL